MDDDLCPPCGSRVVGEEEKAILVDTDVALAQGTKSPMSSPYRVVSVSRVRNPFSSVRGGLRVRIAPADPGAWLKKPYDVYVRSNETVTLLPTTHYREFGAT